MTASRMPAWLAGALLGLSMASAQGATTITRSSAFEYDPNSGLLTKEIIEPDNQQLRLETAYTYDAYGNKIAVTVSSPAPGNAAIATRTSSTGYDSRGQFPTSSTNALNQTETREYDPRFGTVTKLTGPNGLVTTWQYDSFGRKTQEKRADGTQTNWDYQYCNGVYTGTAACPSLAKYLVQTTSLAADGTPSGPYSKTYYDALDRVIRIETQGFNGAVIYQDTVYDSKGRVDRSSRPYYSTQTPQWTVMSYDGIDRPIATTLPDGTQTTVEYHGLITSTTNALGQKQTAQKNSQGKVIQVTDATNNSITYQYDAIGNLTTTTDAKGNVVTLSYDLRGRKTQMIDPDMGTWTYEYDALSQLKTQTDAKGQVTSMLYDKLGRMIQRNETDLTSTWTYDSCTKGIGKLCTSTADNGYTSTASYDSLGRPNSNTTVIDTSYTSGVSYDANTGRIATQTWPTGFAVKYVYNSLGYLTEVRNNADNTLYWQANSKDAQGHLLQQTYGNGVVTQQVYDPIKNRLQNIYAGAGNGVQNLTYGYDSIGNMTSRNDANQNLVETFGYDSLNRLTNATVNSAGAGVVPTTYAYDSIGNITSRSDMGAYTYSPTASRPHALQELNFIHGGKLQYSYDANGNLISEVALDSTGAVITDRGRNEVYTSFNMPQAIGAPGISLAFAYGPEHQRVKQIAPSATTIYLHPDNAGGLAYEKDIKSDGSIEHRHFLTAGDGVIALVKQISTGTTTTTQVLYMHRDHLGSTTAITDDQGNVIERLAYEPFGKRRYPAGNTDDAGTIVGVNTDRGYTNHEHLEELGLIHMNGRIYDPAIGRFMSADPNVQSPYDTQSYNRYAYVINNPLFYTDPTGYSWLGKVLGAATQIVKADVTAAIMPTPHNNNNAFVLSNYLPASVQPGQAQIDQFVMNNKWAYAVGQGVAILLSSPCGGCAGVIWSAYYSYQSSGSIFVAYRNGLLTYATTYAFDYVNASTASPYTRVALNGMVGGTINKLNGGEFIDGFTSGALSQGAREYFKWITGREPQPDLTNGTSGPKDDGIAIHPEGSRLNNMGVAYKPEDIGNLDGLKYWISEDSPIFRGITRTIPGMDTWAQLHDTWGKWLDTNGMWNSVTNYGSMPIAASLTYFAMTSGAPSVELHVDHRKRD